MNIIKKLFFRKYIEKINGMKDDYFFLESRVSALEEKLNLKARDIEFREKWIKYNCNRIQAISQEHSNSDEEFAGSLLVGILSAVYDLFLDIKC
jgi:hypothetical protein